MLFGKFGKIFKHDEYSLIFIVPHNFNCLLFSDKIAIFTHERHSKRTVLFDC